MEQGLELGLALSCECEVERRSLASPEPNGPAAATAAAVNTVPPQTTGLFHHGGLGACFTLLPEGLVMAQVDHDT
jgi:hypothetical protein